MASLSANGLIKVAKSLIPPGRGRPAEASLRRSISTAYYAVFCALGDEVGEALRPPAGPCREKTRDAQFRA